MLVISAFELFCSIRIEAQASSRDVFGVLIRIHEKDIKKLKTNASFMRLKERYGLKNKRYFHSMKYLQMDSPPQVTREHLQIFCRQVSQISFILSCHINEKLKIKIINGEKYHRNLTRNYCSNGNTFYSKLQNILEATQEDCVFPRPKEDIIFETKVDKRRYERRYENLDAFWAQEYIGGDLLIPTRALLAPLPDISKFLFGFKSI